jgi:hypothetical protein
VGGFSKDIGRERSSWIDRCSRAFGVLTDNEIKIGMSLLFGLGEGSRERDLLFRSIEQWKRNFRIETISMNWAVQHPLQNRDGNLGYEYLDWPIERGPLHELLRNFGEASTRYTIVGGTPPTLAETKDIVSTICSLMWQPDGAHP